MKNYDTIVVGSGCAGFCAAARLRELTGGRIALVTEGINMGCSRNTGSDKQTYYKLTTSGDSGDSVMDMARDYRKGGMHGDRALIEASYSLRCFYNLVELGVQFPKNEFGEYVGYRTDHDTHCRATSVGPLTSKVMTECLQKRAMELGVEIVDNCRVVRLAVRSGTVHGIIAIADGEAVAFGARNVVMATGGPAGMFQASVYPHSQTGSQGVMFEAGAAGENLPIFQFGIASTDFRWNLSGSYQQVIPRYFSRDENKSYDFLPADAAELIFKKGYEWPYDATKESSKIDELILRETRELGRKVYMDFRENPCEIPECAREYLENSGALGKTPIERLLKLNPRAYELYLNNGYDLKTTPIEIDVCVQHGNGGIEVDLNCESAVSGLFVIGEAAGIFAGKRPGGSALNSTQVTALRAAEEIARRSACAPDESVLSDALAGVARLAERISGKTDGDVFERIAYARGAMDRAFSARDGSYCREVRELLRSFETIRTKRLTDAFIYRDMLISQLCYLSAACSGIEENPITQLDADTLEVKTRASRTREIPPRELWFEKVYNAERK